MAGLAKSNKDCRTTVLHVPNKRDFIEKFNQSIPSKEFFDSCDRAAALFKIHETRKQQA